MECSNRLTICKLGSAHGGGDLQLQVVQPAAILQRDPRRLPQNLAHRGRLVVVERAQVQEKILVSIEMGIKFNFWPFLSDLI